MACDARTILLLLANAARAACRAVVAGEEAAKEEEKEKKLPSPAAPLRPCLRGTPAKAAAAAAREGVSKVLAGIADAG